MKILLTGYRGFIGKNFVNYFKNNLISYNTYDIKDGYMLPNELDYTDITNVIHLGAISSTTESDIKKLMDLNLTWSILLFEECIKRNINFQWASTASVYGKRTIQEGPFKITDKCKPENHYAYSKFLLEQYIINRNVDIISQGFRYFNVYGPYEEHKGNQASPYTQFSEQAKETGIIKVFEGSENFYRDFIHVDAIIKKHIYNMNKSQSGIFNVGSQKPKSFMDVAVEISKIYNSTIEIIPFPDHLKSHYQEYTCSENN